MHWTFRNLNNAPSFSTRISRFGVMYTLVRNSYGDWILHYIGPRSGAPVMMGRFTHVEAGMRFAEMEYPR